MRLLLRSIVICAAIAVVPALIAAGMTTAREPFDPTALTLSWIVIALVVGVVAGLVLYRASRGCLDVFLNAAKELSAGNLQYRVPSEGDGDVRLFADAFNSMAEQLEEADELNAANLIRETSKSEAILHNIADGVIVTGARGEVIVINAPARGWFDVEEEGCLDRSVVDCARLAGLGELIGEIGESGDSAVHSREIQVEVPGQVRATIINARATRVLTERGEFNGVTTVMRDVTAEREIDRMKTELVSVVAHELRSPLVSIMGFSGILLEENLEISTRLEFARIINDESNRMVEMINKFLDISRIESGKTDVVKVPTDVADLVRQVIEINRGQADTRGMDVHFHAPSRITPITVDPDLIGQALLNLFTNAVKYSPEDTRIDITVTEHRNTIEIAVEDQGYGISDEAQKRLFEKFYRVEDDANVRDVKGTGLGLSLVKEIVEHHNGRVVAESTPGDGSVFMIHLPKAWG